MVNVTKKNKILVFSATYNESKNIKKLIIKIKNNLPNCDILIIDDNMIIFGFICFSRSKSCYYKTDEV